MLFTAQYRKFWIAMLGAVVVIVTQFYPGVEAQAKAIASSVEAVITAITVAAVPNAE